MKILITLLLLIATVARAADDPESVCRTRLRNLGGATKAYRLIHGDKPPAKISDLYLDGLVNSLDDFICPASGTAIKTAAEIDAKSDYTFEPLAGAKDMVVREKTARHGNTILAILADGKIEAIAAAGAPPASPAQAASSPVASQTPAAAEATRSATPAIASATTVVSPAATAAPVTSSLQAGRPNDSTSAPTPAVSDSIESSTDSDESIFEPSVGSSSGSAMRPAGPTAPPSTSRAPTPPSVDLAAKTPEITIEHNELPPFDFSDMLGVSFALQKDGSVTVAEVRANGVGTQMGLKPGDRVVEINEKPVPARESQPRPIKQEELGQLVGAAPDSALQITIERASDKVKTTMSFPPPPKRPR